MSAAFGTSTERLGAVKAQWDPHGAFRTHQAIRATRARPARRPRRVASKEDRMNNVLRNYT